MRLKHYEKHGVNLLGAASLILTLLCAGCGEQQESVPVSPKPVSTTQEQRDEVVQIPSAETSGISIVGSTNGGNGIQILKAVRFGNKPDLDRMVFEFNDVGLPEWEVKYVEASNITDCGSGEQVKVAGNAWLQVKFRGAQAHTEAGEGTSGPMRRILNQIALREVVRTCDFEGDVTWVAGVMRENEYIPKVFTNPSRLVIDIAH